ncbi:rod shape-determining protein MreC [Microaceticoccus formicicus]|uniref:rod shape-determining protein MreC n=1 Tax=Microaceticoccus formicicus TaxID=3118105 RepID=UPI003CCFF749|nr:rod shape-determining protein MreC [Peptoniphilaceae bacterium AMB_02]
MNTDNRKKIIVATVTVFILLIMMAISSRYKNIIPFAEDTVGRVFEPANKAVSFTSTKTKELFVYLFGTRKMRTENAELKLENQKLKEEIAIYSSIIAKAEFLEDEYNLLKKTEYDLKPANITAKDPSNYFINFTIDKGENDSVKVGDVIVTGKKLTDSTFIEAIIGKVEKVGKSWAKVTSVISESSNISFINSRTLEAGVLTGRNEKGMSGYVFEPNSDIKIGDKLMTSGVGGVYPRNLYIGDVVDVKLTEDLIVEIIVETKVDFTSLYRVLILDRNEGKYEQD